MTWTAALENVYKLCLLDTNAISDIVKRPEIEGRGFILTFPPSIYAPCLTVYSLIELRRVEALLRDSSNFFNAIRFFF